MKILLTGKNGQVGFELRRALSLLGDVVAVDQAECDLSNEAAIRSLCKTVSPRLIINPAAYTAVDKAESDSNLAFAVNGMAPGVLGQEAERLGALMIHYSTDYVFDGTSDGFYRENDLTNPQGVYGKSKLAGEIALQNSGARHLILRTSWVVGAHGGNFAKTMLRLAIDREALSVVADQFGAPTSAALLADSTAHIAKTLLASPRDISRDGIYHLAAAGVTNWHEYACYVIERARTAGLPIKVAKNAIQAIRSVDYPTPAIRPANSRLSTEKIKKAFGLHIPDWRVGLDHILDQII